MHCELKELIDIWLFNFNFVEVRVQFYLAIRPLFMRNFSITIFFEELRLFD